MRELADGDAAAAALLARSLAEQETRLCAAWESERAAATASAVQLAEGASLRQWHEALAAAEDVATAARQAREAGDLRKAPVNKQQGAQEQKSRLSEPLHSVLCKAFTLSHTLLHDQLYCEKKGHAGPLPRHQNIHAAGEAADARLLAERERHRLEVEKLQARAARTLEEAAAQALALRL